MNEQQNRPDTLDLRSYLRPVWRRKWIILAIVVVATAATYYISSHQRKSYVASTTLYVQTADPTQNIGSSSTASPPPTAQAIADVAQLVLAQKVTNDVARQLGMPVPVNSVAVTPSTGSDFVTITATSGSPELAARLANTYASAFLQSRQHAVVVQARRDLRAARAALASIPSDPRNLTALGERQTVAQQIATYRQLILNPPAGAQQIDTALAPAAPSSPKPIRDAIFGGVVGLVLALIVAFCLELLDRRLVRVSTVESALDRPVLAVLPHVSNPAPLSKAHRPVVPAPFLEELRSLTVKLRLLGQNEAPRVIMVTSALPREGKSTVVRDLALIYAEVGNRVLVIDGDLRRPSVERLFGVDAEEGLAQLLRRAGTEPPVMPKTVLLPDAAQAPNGHGPLSSNGNSSRLHGSVEVLPHGERVANPLALLSSERMLTLLEQARQEYDIVLLDTPPVLAVADCVPLLEIVDSVLLVVRLGQTTEQAADGFIKLLDGLSDVPFSGVIVNDVRGQSDDDGYGSYGRYGYGYYAKGRRERRQMATMSAP